MKTILITGSTDGIGKIAAEKLAAMGHRVLLHGRNPIKLQSCLEALQQAGGDVQGYLADLSDLQAVQALAARIDAEHEGLDVIVNNAGVYGAPAAATNAFDMRLVVNYLAPVVLTSGLMSRLKKTGAGRIINLSSGAQDHFEESFFHEGYSETDRIAYGQSKLALTMWTALLALDEPEVLCISLNPGSLLNTNMVRDAFGQHWSEADKGGDIIVDLCLSERHLGHTGEYYNNDKGDYDTAHEDVYHDHQRERLHQWTKALLADTLPS